MGKLSRNQRSARLERELEGLDPYTKSGAAAIPRGKRQAFTSQVATGHPGTKRRHVPAGWRPLALFTDESGKLAHFWPKRKRRGRQAAAMGQLDREQHYTAQTGRSVLTGPQRRRSEHKFNRAMARAR